MELAAPINQSSSSSSSSSKKKKTTKTLTSRRSTASKPTNRDGVGPSRLRLPTVGAKSSTRDDDDRRKLIPAFDDDDGEERANASNPSTTTTRTAVRTPSRSERNGREFFVVDDDELLLPSTAADVLVATTTTTSGHDIEDAADSGKSALTRIWSELGPLDGPVVAGCSPSKNEINAVRNAAAEAAGATTMRSQVSSGERCTALGSAAARRSSTVDDESPTVGVASSHRVRVLVGGLSGDIGSSSCKNTTARELPNAAERCRRPEVDCIGDEPRGSKGRKAEHSRRQRAKRLAKQTGLAVWKGIRVGCRYAFRGMVMLSATTTMNFNVSDGATRAWRQWTADHDDQHTNDYGRQRTTAW